MKFNKITIYDSLTYDYPVSQSMLFLHLINVIHIMCFISPEYSCTHFNTF